MIGDQSHKYPLVIKEFSIEKNQTIRRVLVFVKETLPEFERLFHQSGINISKEDEISKELLRYFNDKARTDNLLFQFNEKKEVDFTVFLLHPYTMGASSIFMIEAKRLAKNKYDYVSGRNGGVERIKREREEFGKHLNYGAMVGYIQDENHEFWETRVNAWIDDLIEAKTDIEWNPNDKLKPNLELSDFTSVHKRISAKPITLYHYWIILN